MSTAEVVALIIGCLSYCALTWAALRRWAWPNPIREPETTPLDIPRARREAHALGLPFVEADGTLSWPPETGEQVHDRIHARRLLAEQRIALDPDPLCSECEGKGVLVLGYATFDPTGAVRRAIRPCPACRPDL